MRLPSVRRLFRKCIRVGARTKDLASFFPPTPLECSTTRAEVVFTKFVAKHFSIADHLPLGCFRILRLHGISVQLVLLKLLNYTARPSQLHLSV